MKIILPTTKQAGGEWRGGTEAKFKGKGNALDFKILLRMICINVSVFTIRCLYKCSLVSVYVSRQFPTLLGCPHGPGFCGKIYSCLPFVATIPE